MSNVVRHRHDRSQRLCLRRSALDAIERHAERESPLECCGVLLGRAGEVVSAKPARNLLSDKSRFEADPLQLMHIERAARRAELSVLGYYHSHPACDPLPSKLDQVADPWPDLPPHFHLIVSPGRGWAVYSTRGGTWTAIEVEVIDDAGTVEAEA